MQKKEIAVEKYILDIYEKKLQDFIIHTDEKWAIYGTGNGAEVIYEILEKWNIVHVITAIIDNDDVVSQKDQFHNIPVTSLEDTYEWIDGIIIAAMDYHELVYARVMNQLAAFKNERIKVINPFGHNTETEVKQYISYMEDRYRFKDEDLFEKFDASEIELREEDTKVIAWYLPQFHRMEINDDYYGRGFTEWTNTTRAIPMFYGHEQPHIPYDVGYYDLNNPEVFERQIYLAKHYGIYGFSFYYYWFSGKQIMEKPVYYFLKHQELDFNFCLTWANENWSALWDGNNNELIYEQKLQKEDDRKFIEDIIPFIADKRYIRIDGKALLIVYRPNLWEKDRIRKLFDNFRNEMARRGMGDLYIGICNARGFDEEARAWGADALIEFPPHGIGTWTPITRIDGYLNPNFVGHIRETKDFIINQSYLYKHQSEVFYRGAMPSWDNTARKAYNGATIYKGLNPVSFYKWMLDIMTESKKIHTKNQNIVFVNAWNEWAEGNHLEPDMRYGYANLNAIKRAIIDSR